MVDVSETIGQWVDKLKEMFGGKAEKVPATAPNNSKQTPAPGTPPPDSGYQAPIKGSWKNSGDFSPGVATDARHQKGHNGIDMRASGGTSVYPIAAGIVTNVGTDPMGGNVVNIKHDKGIATYYAHLGTTQVQKGQNVTKDTVIGTIGDSGNAKGTFPHCHFQVWNNGQIANPAGFFTVPKYTNVDKTEQQWLPGQQEVAKSWNNQRSKNRVASAKISILCEGCDVYLKLSKKLDG